ncbi:unnamed protein product [Spirodela intermedia]|uniref:Uncharacterized protein n=1 Tax=Spirodela intermedia TaxID=51605 RepID=A0A7I8J2Q4_SPIIN|nr:unnamed protein product [Spirodela intermedia]CAA6664506.1 unnamed protein product [Spirodela intermedia]
MISLSLSLELLRICLLHWAFLLRGGQPHPTAAPSRGLLLLLPRRPESYALRLGGEFSDRRGSSATQIALAGGRPSAAAPEDELDVFSAEKYFSGAGRSLRRRGRGHGGRPPRRRRARRRGQKVRCGRSCSACSRVPAPTRPPSRWTTPRAAPAAAEGGSPPGPAGELEQEGGLLLGGASFDCGGGGGDGRKASSGQRRDGQFQLGQPGIAPPTPRGAGAGAGEDDACSESSSELFEIESISTGTLALGWEGGASAATCYEPSEASIEWSVVTASAADGEASPPPPPPPPPPPGRKWAEEEGWRGSQRRRRAGGLLGCGGVKVVMPERARAPPGPPPQRSPPSGAARWRRARRGPRSPPRLHVCSRL